MLHKDTYNFSELSYSQQSEIIGAALALIEVGYFEGAMKFIERSGISDNDAKGNVRGYLLYKMLGIIKDRRGDTPFQKFYFRLSNDLIVKPDMSFHRFDKVNFQPLFLVELSKCHPDFVRKFFNNALFGNIHLFPERFVQSAIDQAYSDENFEAASILEGARRASLNYLSSYYLLLCKAFKG